MSITYQFGGAPEIERISRSVLPEDDPLQASTFFPNFAESIRGITDVETYHLGYGNAVDKLPSELGSTMPPQFERTLLRRLCHSSDFIAAWAQQAEDWALLFGSRPVLSIRYVLWPPDWWPVVLPIYLCLILSVCGAIAYHLVGPQALPRLMTIAQGGVSILIVAEFAWIIVYFYGMAGSALFLLMALFFEGIDSVGYRGTKRLEAIERRRKRKERQTHQAALTRQRAQADPRGFLRERLAYGLVAGLVLGLPFLLLQNIAYHMERAELASWMLNTAFLLIVSFSIIPPALSARKHHISFMRLFG